MPDIFNSNVKADAPVGGTASTDTASSVTPLATLPPTPTPPTTLPQTPAGADANFSFQNQPNQNGGVIPQPTVPFETISLQNVEPVATLPKSSQTFPAPESGDIKLDVLRRQEEATAASGMETPPPSSFLDRFKEEEPAEPKRPLEEAFTPSDAASFKQPEEKPEKPATSSNYQMPGLPQNSFVTRLLPFALVFLVVGLAIFVATRFLPQFTSQKQVELTWWGMWEDEKVMQVAIDSYRREKPNVKINYVKENKIDYRTRLQTAIARDQGPDIFRFHNTWVPMLKSELTAMPENLKTQIDFTNNFYPTAYYDLVRDNKIYGVPLMFDGLALYYNTDIFQDAGLSAPTSWDEVLETARKLTVFDDNENIKVAGIALGNTNVEHWSDILGTMLLQNAADPALPTDTCTKEAIEYYMSFATGETRVWDSTLGNSVLAFGGNKVAMILAPSWQAFELKKINPDLNFKIVPFPQIPGGKRYWATYWAEGVNSKSKNAKEAWDFLMFLSKKETLQLMYAEAAKSSPERLFGEIYPRQDMAGLMKNDSLVMAYLTGAKEAKSWYLASRTFDQGINDRMIKYYEDLINKLENKEESIDEALKTVALGVAQVYRDYGLTVPAANPSCKVPSQ